MWLFQTCSPRVREGKGELAKNGSDVKLKKQIHGAVAAVLIMLGSIVETRKKDVRCGDTAAVADNKLGIRRRHVERCLAISYFRLLRPPSIPDFLCWFIHPLLLLAQGVPSPVIVPTCLLGTEPCHRVTCAPSIIPREVRVHDQVSEVTCTCYDPLISGDNLLPCFHWTRSENLH